MSGCMPIHLRIPGSRPSHVELRGMSPTLVSEAHNLARQTRSRGAHRWSQTLTYDARRRDEWAPIAGFADAQQGQYGTYTVPVVGLETPRGAAPSPYLRCPGANGDYASTPRTPAIAITGDIDIVVRLAADDYTPAAHQILAARWNATDQWSWFFSLRSTGLLRLGLSFDGTAGTAGGWNSDQATGISDGTETFFRATRAAASGAISFYTSANGWAWSPLGGVVSGTAGDLYDSSAPLEVGGYYLGTAENFAGRIHYAEVRRSIGGDPVARFDPSQHVAGTTWASDTGEAWTRAGGTYIADCGAAVVGAVAAGQISVPIDGLAVRTLVLCRRDLVKFEGHRKIYAVTADVWTDGAGAASLGLNCPLLSALADNERMRCGSLYMTAQFLSDEAPVGFGAGSVSPSGEYAMVEQPL